MVFCVLLSFFAFAVGPRIGYARETIEHAGLMIALWAPTLGILGVRAELQQQREQDLLKKNLEPSLRRVSEQLSPSGIEASDSRI
jgi:hypothetical protein